MKKVLFISIALLLSFSLCSQDRNLFEEQYFIQDEDTLRCRILTPQNFDIKKKYPLVVFLHGAGERGTDNIKQLDWGADLFLDSLNRIKFPAIIVFPQCPENEYWANVKRSEQKDSLGGFTIDTLAKAGSTSTMVLKFIDTLLAHGGIDRTRVYLGGLSMGGFGTFEFLWRRSDLFAAAFPVCGGGSPEKTRLYAKKLPLWIFHGDADPIVPVQHSRRMVQAMKKTTVEVKYTEYPEVGHDSWKNAFAEPELLPWLFSKKKLSAK